MGQRFIEDDIWDQDWFLDMPDNYKLFYLFIHSNCDGAGFWRVNKRKFQLVSKITYLDDFLDAVNKDEDGKPTKKRIIQVEKGKWFFPDFVSQQCGNKLNFQIGAHRGALKRLVLNGISLAEIPNVDFGGLEMLDNQSLKKIVHVKTWYREYVDNTYSKDTALEREREREREKERESKDKSVREGAKNEELTYEAEPTYVVPEMLKIYKKHLPNYPEDQERDFAALRSVSEFITKQTPELKFDFKYTLEKWEAICTFISGNDFYGSKSLKTISSHIQAVYQETFNPKINGKSKRVNSREAGMSYTAERLLERLKGLDS